MNSPSSTIIVPSLVLLPRSAQFGNFFAPYGWTIIRIINLSLTTGEMLRELKCAMLRPLLKKAIADPEVFSNFRSVSNLKYVSKLIEKAVAAQLNGYLVCNEVPLQSVYKTCHSTETALMKVHNDIMLSLDSGDSVISVLQPLLTLLTMTYSCVDLKSVLELLVPFLNGSSHISVIVLNLSASINLV